MTFHVGQKVVCVNASFRNGPWDKGRVNLPVLNSIYTVRDVGTEWWADGAVDEALWLAEIANPVARWSIGPSPRELGFWAQRFVPVRETDISIFTAMLNKQPERV
jgi:hypothetical protein